MQLLKRILSLRPCVLILLSTFSSYTIAAGAADTAAKPWTDNRALALRQEVNYERPEHLLLRDLRIQERMATELPVAVRKMTGDPSEMFFLHYWQFAGNQPDAVVEDEHPKERRIEEICGLRRASEKEYANTSAPMAFLSPFLLHRDDTQQLPGMSPRSFGRSTLNAQRFQCPAGTGSCASIDRPDSCCGLREDCVIIPSTAELGDVGCCPQGAHCQGSPVGCDTSAGYSSCPGSSNGGCCIPNFVCDGVGCLYRAPGTVTVVTTDEPATVGASVETEYTTSPEVVTVTNTETTYTLPIIGGTGTTVITTVITASLAVRPTVNTVTVVAVSATTTTVVASVCPTGYYACSAYYPSPAGCCQIGRDCGMTNCPVLASSNVVDTSAVTVVIPTGTAASTVVIVQGESSTTSGTASVVTAGGGTVGSCAAGWYQCSIDTDGCCPSGYVCGADATCTNSDANGPGTVKEIAPNGSSVEGFGPWLIALAIANLILCVLL